MKPMPLCGLLMALALASCDSATESAPTPSPSTDTPRDSVLVVADPSFSPKAGTYATAQAISITSTTPGARIHYTTDGSAPTSSSPTFVAPIEVGATVTIRAIAVKSGSTSSAVTSAAYSITPVVPPAGSITDGTRSYRTVKVGSQTWMAENLSYAGSAGKTGMCYSSNADSCAKYGRLYAWAEIMDGAASTTTSKVRGICPVGWHVPTDDEWTTLVASVESDTKIGSELGGTALKSTTGWRSYGNGTDILGFAGLPSGSLSGEGVNNGDLGYNAYFWSATEFGTSDVWIRGLSRTTANVSRSANYKTDRYSLRCLKD